MLALMSQGQQNTRRNGDKHYTPLIIGVLWLKGTGPTTPFSLLGLLYAIPEGAAKYNQRLVPWFLWSTFEACGCFLKGEALERKPIIHSLRSWTFSFCGKPFRVVHKRFGLFVDPSTQEVRQNGPILGHTDPTAKKEASCC